MNTKHVFFLLITLILDCDYCKQWEKCDDNCKPRETCNNKEDKGLFVEVSLSLVLRVTLLKYFT